MLDSKFSHTFLIFMGAGLGGVCRYWVSNSTYWLLGRQFPYGTLMVNTTGSFFIGILFVLILQKFSNFSAELRSLLIIGFLGGYTTFSSFSLETVTLFEKGAWLSGCLNILLSVTLCIALAWLGIAGGRQL